MTITSTEVFTVIIGSDSSGSLFEAEAFEYEGKLWFVVGWLEAPEHKIRKPELVIRFDNLKHQALRPPYRQRYVLNDPLPAAVLDGSSTEGFETLSGTDLRLWFPMREPTGRVS